jgi:hypothetical protein
VSLRLRLNRNPEFEFEPPCASASHHNVPSLAEYRTLHSTVHLTPGDFQKLRYPCHRSAASLLNLCQQTSAVTNLLHFLIRACSICSTLENQEYQLKPESLYQHDKDYSFQIKSVLEFFAFNSLHKTHDSSLMTM